MEGNAFAAEHGARAYNRIGFSGFCNTGLIEINSITLVEFVKPNLITIAEHLIFRLHALKQTVPAKFQYVLKADPLTVKSV